MCLGEGVLRTRCNERGGLDTPGVGGESLLVEEVGGEGG